MPPSTFSELVNHILSIISIMIPVLIGVTVMYFIWKLVDAWIINGGDEKKVEEGKHIAIIGVVVFVVMVTVWAVVAFLNASIFG